MSIRRASSIVLAMLILLAPAIPARADQEKKDKRKIEVRGTILSLDVRRRSFLLWENRRRNDQRNWAVEVNAKTDIENDKRDDDDRDRDDRDRLERRRTFRGLRVGDEVEVEGRLLGNQHILAEDIEILRRGKVPFSPVVIVPPVQPVPYPQPVTRPFQFAPEILQPANGAGITTPEFTIVGRTFPRSQVHIEVAGEYLTFQLPIASADVVADHNGFFAHTVRPQLRVPGATYRINVTARDQGLVSPRTTLIVRQM